MEDTKQIEMTVVFTLDVPRDTPVENLCMTRPLFRLQCPSVLHGILGHETINVRELNQDDEIPDEVFDALAKLPQPPDED